MKQKTVNLYEFDELSDKAKEKARDWWRTAEAQEFEPDMEDFNQLAEILGVEFRQNAYRTVGGKTGYEPAIYWGLHTQGSGASFKGRYGFSEGSAARMKEYAPIDEELNRIATGLAELQERYSHQLTATIYTRGNDVASYAMQLDDEIFAGDDREISQDDEKTLLELLRSFANWMYKTIDEEYDYRMTDENVDESIRANGYTFLENGKRED